MQVCVYSGVLSGQVFPRVLERCNSACVQTNTNGPGPDSVCLLWTMHWALIFSLYYCMNVSLCRLDPCCIDSCGLSGLWGKLSPSIQYWNAVEVSWFRSSHCIICVYPLPHVFTLYHILLPFTIYCYPLPYGATLYRISWVFPFGIIFMLVLILLDPLVV